MLLTTADNYKYFNDGIKKEQTSVVPPFMFNRIANDAQDLWLADKVTEIELNQKRIDDISVLRVVTDGYYEYTDTNVPVPVAQLINPITPDSIQGDSFSLPFDGILINNTSGVPMVYPKYYRLLNVMFKIVYIEDKCKRTGISDWMLAWIIRSDQRTIFYSNPYRKPTNDRLYYEIINKKVRLDTGPNNPSYPHSMRLEYIRWPRKMYYDVLSQADSINPMLSDGSFTPGLGSVNFELPEVQRREIMDVAIRIYLERIKDPRYQSYLVEQRIGSESK